MMKTFLAAVAALTLTAGTASAAIVINSGDGLGPTAVHTQGSQTGNVVYGEVEGNQVAFQSSTLLQANGSGVAKVDGADSDKMFNDLSIYFTDYAYGINSLNFSFFTKVAKPVNVAVEIFYVGGGSSAGSFQLLSNLTKWNIFDDGGKAFEKITFTADKGIEDIRQVALAPGVAAIPEPGTWALMIVGFGLAGAALRRQREQTAALSVA
jgi:hypothetical protein